MNKKRCSLTKNQDLLYHQVFHYCKLLNDECPEINIVDDYGTFSLGNVLDNFYTFYNYHYFNRDCFLIFTKDNRQILIRTTINDESYKLWWEYNNKKIKLFLKS
jgi:hypothetical protein